MDIIGKIKSESFNTLTTEKLRSHPLILAAETGTLNLHCIQRFVYEQFYVVRSDMASLKQGLKAHGDTSPAYQEFFEFFLSGEIHLKELHTKLAHALSISEQDMEAFEPSPLCQAYPSKFCQLVSQSDPSVVAIAFSVNFPAWGKICGRFKSALLANYSQKLGLNEGNLEFLSYCAEPIDCLDSLVDKVADASRNLLQYDIDILYKEIKDAVRLLQEYEVMFWDGVYRMHEPKPTK